VFDARYSDLRTRIETACALRYIDWLTVVASVQEVPIFADYNVDGDSSQRFLLHLAVRKRKHEYANYLLHHGAGVNSQDSKHRTPLHVAVDNEDVELVRTLVLRHAADVNAADKSGETPLFSAVRLAASNKDMAQTLVECLVRECGANINAIKSNGRTVLFSAARIGVLEFIYWLVLELKADCSVTDNDGHNAASRAEQYHHEQVAMFLYVALTSQFHLS
jgi:ankyrin repeat protein